jgi:hypothetical protein
VPPLPGPSWNAALGQLVDEYIRPLGERLPDEQSFTLPPAVADDAGVADGVAKPLRYACDLYRCLLPGGRESP